MNESQIKDGLRDLVLVEPALGFDPDDVATRAAKRRLTRRASIATGAGTLAVIGVVSAMLATGPGSAAPATQSEDIHAQIERNKRHLENVLPGLLDHARDIKVDGKPSGPGLVTEHGHVPFEDLAMMHAVVDGKDGLLAFSTVISGLKPYAAGQVSLSEQVCFGDSPDSRPLPERPDPGWPINGTGGQSLPNAQCRKLSQADGSIVTVVSYDAPGMTDPSRPSERFLAVIHYRKNGVYVGYFSQGMVDANGERFKSALTEQNAIKLVTDPALYLR